MSIATERTPAVVPWAKFARIFKGAHRQGEHVAIVGQTGSGKSVLEVELCKVLATRKTKDGRPASVVILGTKPRDETLSALGWPVIKKWPPSYGQEACIVWPRAKNPETAAREQRKVFRPLLNTIYQEGGQTIGIDEAGYFEDPQPDGLGLSTTMKQFWTTARSLKLTLVATTQRPRHVTRSMWSEPSWLFIFPPDDDEDLKRVAQLSGARDQVLEVVEGLGGYEVLCVRKQRDQGVKQLYVTKVGT